jgi:hypothetical protein
MAAFHGRQASPIDLNRVDVNRVHVNRVMERFKDYQWFQLRPPGVKGRPGIAG